MAVTAVPVLVGHNFIRYRIVQDGTAGTTLNITSTGAASPDLLTDSVAGPLKQIAKVITDGYGQFASGAQTQAKARALWLSDWSGAQPGQTANSKIVTARCDLTSRGELEFAVDANVSGGNPVIAITATASASTGYLDVRVPNTTGI